MCCVFADVVNDLQGKCVEEEVVDGDSVGGNITYLLPDISFLYTYNTHTHTHTHTHIHTFFPSLSLKFP